jgi:hypothetical protein
MNPNPAEIMPETRLEKGAFRHSQGPSTTLNRGND